MVPKDRLFMKGQVRFQVQELAGLHQLKMNLYQGRFIHLKLQLLDILLQFQVRQGFWIISQEEEVSRRMQNPEISLSQYLV